MRVKHEAATWQMTAFTESISLTWLSAESPSRDVVVSSRARLARNLAEYPFPRQASPIQLIEIKDQVLAACQELNWISAFDEAERAYLLRCRLVSPEFQASAPGRSLGISDSGNLSVMVNEEDHVRAQALVAGWNPAIVEAQVRRIVDPLATKLAFAFDPRVGFLTASPANAGVGARISAMFHLVGLAYRGRIRNVLRALSDQNVIIRGIFGEGTRPVGAFYQVSMTRAYHPEFSGACEFLICSERNARDEVTDSDLWNQVQGTVSNTISRRTVTYEESLWACAWIRWAAGRQLWGDLLTVEDVDRWLIQLPMKEGEPTTDRFRASSLRKFLEPYWMPNQTVAPNRSR